MVRNCVENFEMKILNEFKLNKKVGCSGWVDGWMGGCKSRVKDCLQQSKS